MTDAQTEKYNTMKTDRYTYRRDSDTVSPQEIDSALKACRNSDERLAAVKKYLADKSGKNRFFIPDAENGKPEKRGFFRR